MASSSPVGETTLRASGRIRKQPVNYASSPTGSSKRKRNDADPADEDEVMEDQDASDDDEDESEEEPDEEELRAQKAQKSKKPAAKKPKTNGASGPAKKRQPRKARGIAGDDAEAAGGLYAEVFASGETLEAIAASWIKSFEAHASSSVADLVNFVLRCAGCHGTVEPDHVEDPDGVTNKLDDLRDEYQASNPTDYPLIAKGKQATAFKASVTGFFHVLIKTIAASGHLYTTRELIENIEVWFSTMSSAPNRSFRHTATVASLSIVTALCEVAHENAQEIANHQQMAKTESKKAKPNKNRVQQMEATIAEKSEAQEFVESLLKDWFDTVFIHRYRDVDPVIRRDCIAALGDWLIAMPDVFFDGQHLRYLGWVLSDPTAATRGEVLKQLLRLYKDQDRLGGLKTFTEKFRSRMVEIATNDAEVHVRISGIELLDCLRENGLLEPDDIDAVGRLVFDADARIRKAVAGFFSENVQDLYNSKIDELGGSEALDDVVPDEADGNYEMPTLEWLRFKAVSEMLQTYDAEDGLPSEVDRSRGDGRLSLHFGSTDSRFVLAADTLYEKIDEIQSWQSLAGYLLFDNSSRKKGKKNDPLAQFKQECVLEEKEEAVLLEVLNASVKRFLTDLGDKLTAPKTTLSKKRKEELQDELQEAARDLATLIPKLLKKFGEAPSTAAAVLRIEGVLNLPALSDLQQDSTTYSALLDDVRKQFMSHGTDDVLGPASSAILHAKSYGELDDLTEEKVSGLWDDVIGNLAELLHPDTITVRGASSNEQLVALSNNLLRIIRLATVSNCIPSLEDSAVAHSNKKTGVSYEGAIDYIIALVQRASHAAGPEPDDDDASLEDQVAGRAAEAALFYFMWQLKSIDSAVKTGSGVEFEQLEPLAARRDTYVDNMKATLGSRKASEDISNVLCGCALEMFSSTAILRDLKPRAGVSDDYTALIMKIEPALQKSIIKVFDVAEKKYAKLAGKKLDEAVTDEDQLDIDADPIDDDPVSDIESEEEDENENASNRKEVKALQTLLAEQKLCALTGKIIHSVMADVIDIQSTRKRLERNRTKLGNNYKECCAYLDVKGAKDKKSKAKAKPASKANGSKSKKSNAIVAEDEMDDEIEDDEEEVEQEVDEMDVDEEETGDGAPAEEAESVLGD